MFPLKKQNLAGQSTMTEWNFSMDWIKGTFTGKPHISWEHRWCPVKIFP
jgi:hypothetical protein